MRCSRLCNGYFRCCISKQRCYLFSNRFLKTLTRSLLPKLTGTEYMIPLNGNWERLIISLQKWETGSMIRASRFQSHYRRIWPIYQDLKDFVLLYKAGTDEVMNDAVWECRMNFE